MTDKNREYDSSIIWIPSGLAAKILGVCISTLYVKYQGSIRVIREPGGNRRWCLEDCQKLAKELLNK